MKLSSALELLRKYGINAPGKVVSLDEALTMPRPIVLKPDTIEHKTELKLVFVGLKEDEEIKKAYEEIKSKGFEVIAQPLVKGFEFIVGVKEDASFGKVIMLGLGGTFAELFRDVSFRVLPITRADALEMCSEIKASRLFSGFRGKRANKEAVVDVLLKVSDLAEKEDVKEMDINPLIVNESAAYAVDVRIFK